MAAINLGKLNLAQLNALSAQLERRKQSLTGDGVAKCRKAIVKLIDNSGLTVRDVLGEQAERLLAGSAKAGRAGGKAAAKTTKGKKLGKVAPKYRHPQNPDLLWTGRGMKPKWVVEWLDGGGTMDALVIAKSPEAAAPAASVS